MMTLHDDNDDDIFHDDGLPRKMNPKQMGEAAQWQFRNETLASVGLCINGCGRKVFDRPGARLCGECFLKTLDVMMYEADKDADE